MTCNFLQLSAYLDNELTSHEQESVEIHLSQCSNCQQKFSEYQNDRFWLKKAHQQWMLDLKISTSHPVDFSSTIISRLHEGMISDFQLSLYLDQELPPQEQKRIASHLDICASCAESYRSFQKNRAIFSLGKTAVRWVERDLSDSILKRIASEPSLNASTLIEVNSEHLGDKLSAYLDHDLPEPLQHAFDKHCETCAYCASQVKQMRSAIHLLKSANQSTQHWTPESYRTEVATSPKFLAQPLSKNVPWKPHPFSRQIFWLQAAVILLIGGLFWKAPWWGSKLVSHSESNHAHSSNASNLSEDASLAERMSQFQKNLEIALASFPKPAEVSNQKVLEESLKKIEDCLRQNEKLVTQNKMPHSPYEGDLLLIKAILMELELKCYGGFLEPSRLSQKLNELKQRYTLALKAFERPFALTHFRLPPDLTSRNLAPRYDQVSAILKDVKKIIQQLETECHQ